MNVKLWILVLFLAAGMAGYVTLELLLRRRKEEDDNAESCRRDSDGGPASQHKAGEM